MPGASFAPLVAEGRVVFQTINVDRPENRHFIKDYQLVSKTVIMAVGVYMTRSGPLDLI